MRIVCQKSKKERGEKKRRRKNYENIRLQFDSLNGIQFLLKKNNYYTCTTNFI